MAYQITAAEANCNPLETALFFLSAKMYPYQQVDADLRLSNAPTDNQSSATPRAALSLLAAYALAAHPGLIPQGPGYSLQPILLGVAHVGVDGDDALVRQWRIVIDLVDVDLTPPPAGLKRIT